MSRSSEWVAGMDRGSDAALSDCIFSSSVGSASTASASTEIVSVRPGWVMAGRSSAGHIRGSRVEADSRHSTGTRGRSMRRPSLTRTAGSTVSEPSTATATTMMEPVASEANTALRARNRPSIETMTATPDTMTECPAVSAAISIASRWPRPRCRSARTRLT